MEKEVKDILKKHKKTLEKRFNQLLDEGFIDFIPELDIAFIEVNEKDFRQELEDIEDFEESNIIISDSIPWEKEIYVQT